MKLLSALVDTREDMSKLGAMLGFRFFLNEPASVYPLVRELEYKHYYVLDNIPTCHRVAGWLWERFRMADRGCPRPPQRIQALRSRHRRSPGQGHRKCGRERGSGRVLSIQHSAQGDGLSVHV